MRIRLGIFVLCLVIIGAAAWNLVPWNTIQAWAAGQQRSFQNVMAGGLRSIQAGEAWAVWTLCSATAAYGFFHALGPGHGKVLIGAAALASDATIKRLAVLTVLSSLAQALSAIFLVSSLVFLLQLGSGDLAMMTETWLAPASYIAIAAIGSVLVFRGARTWYRLNRNGNSATKCCGHAHGPSVAEVSTLSSTRDAVALVASIAIRPCTGALFVLVIAARFDAFATGCLAVITMGLGTAAFNLTVATSGVAARRLARFGAHDHDAIQAVSATLHVTGGALILMISLGMLMPYF